MKEYEKMTKEKLIDVIDKLTKALDGYKQQVACIMEKQDELELLKFLYKDYIFATEENRNINQSLKLMEQRIMDLQELCERQQKIIDSER